MKKKTNTLNVIEYDKVKFISVPDLIQYLDDIAMDFEQAKDAAGVEILNKLADILSKV